ncbi:hypothetical protein SDC9_155087 [bioreactor metagenome]|uniref:Uncharacterized protein n=1 Tax=bioreactor metagenome TaxID=1076179 RepID=A0A645F0I4_9ZZZZ
MVPLHILRIDFGNDQRHVLLHAEGTRIIHKYGAGRLDGWRIFFSDLILRSAQHDIHAGKGALAGFLHHDGLALKIDGAARAAATGQRPQRSYGEVPLFQNFQHLTAHGSRGAQYGYVILFHLSFPPIMKLLYNTRMVFSKSLFSTPTMM